MGKLEKCLYIIELLSRGKPMSLQGNQPSLGVFLSL